MLCVRFYDTRDQTMRQAQLEKVDVYPEKADAMHLRFTDAKVAELRGWPEVRLAFPSIEIYANVSGNNDKQHLLVISSSVGGDPQTCEGLMWGHGMEEGKEQVVISKAVLTRLGGKLTHAGPEPAKLTVEVQRKLNGKDQVERRSLPIVGITKHDSRDRVFVPLPFARLIDNWARGFVVNLDGQHHKEEEGLSTPFAIAYGPVSEESRAVKELAEQNLDVKKVGRVSTVSFAGTVWALLDGSAMLTTDGEAQPQGVLVRPGYRVKIGDGIWVAWDTDDPRWKQFRSDGYDELGWVGTEVAVDLPSLTRGTRIPVGLIPTGARLTNARTLRWLLFDAQRFGGAKGELIRTPDGLEASQREKQAPGSVWAATSTSSVVVRPVVQDIRTSLDNLLKRHGKANLRVEELPGMATSVAVKYAKGSVEYRKMIVLRVPHDLLQMFADGRVDVRSAAVLVTPNAKAIPESVKLHEKDVPLAAVLDGPNECLLIDRSQFKFGAPEPKQTHVWLNGPWHIVGQVLAEVREQFQADEALSKMPTSYTMLTPARDGVVTRNTKPDRKAVTIRYLAGEIVVEKNVAPIKVISHSSAGFGDGFDLQRLLCNDKLARTGWCELRLPGVGDRSFKTGYFVGLPPDVAVVHDEVFRQIAFVTGDNGVMPSQIQKIVMLGIENPVLLPALEELAKKHKQPLTWLTPIQLREMNKYQIKEKHQPIMQETVRWLGTMRPAIDFAESIATVKVHVRGEQWTLVGSEIRSPMAFEVGMRSGQWFGGKDPFEAVLPAELAQRQRVNVGDAVIVQLPRNEEKGEQAISVRLKVIGLSSDEFPHVSASLCRDVSLWRKRVLEFNEAKHGFESPVEANKNLGDHRIVVFARSEADVKTLVQKLHERGYKTEDRLQEMESLRHLSLVLTAFAGSLVFGFIIMSLITVWVTTLMQVQSKSWEIGILRSIGLSAANVLRIFVVQGVFAFRNEKLAPRTGLELRHKG
jgi:hypothetical protein